MKYVIVTVFALLFSFSAHAEDWIVINDMSQIKWQMDPNGRVNFRNLNEFHPQALPCCYNYYLDTTTDAGKSAWSVIQTKMVTSSKLILGVANINEPGPITFLGNW